ncbi:MAG: DUF4118 domain-containing protein [Armatimonadetes bacterium]|nr:DUF4118 domain-containing protein [Armatimonadota bacterium]
MKRKNFRWQAYLLSSGAVGCAVLLAKALESILHLSSLSLVFLSAVLCVSVAWGLGPSIWASALSVLAYNFLFVPPLYTFTVASAHDLLTLCVFLIVAMLTSGLVARVREQAEELERARLIEETQRLERTLLSLVSHDFRTPLAAITGAVTSLLGYEETYDSRARHDLLLTIHEEADRLNRFVTNLLDMSRLEAGSLTLNRDWIAVEDLIGAALDRSAQALSQHPTEVNVPPDLPMLFGDFVLLEHAVAALLDNAAKYSPPGSLIRVSVTRERDVILLEVKDQGRGIPAAERDRIFDRFYRVAGGDGQIAGTGLGLAICRGIVEAHGGKAAVVAPSSGQGSVFSMRLPRTSPPPSPEGRDADEPASCSRAGS